MNIQLVNSLVEVVLNLSPEDQELFQSKLNIRQVEEVTNKKLKSTEKAEQFRQWVAQFPKSSISLPAEASQRENIYAITLQMGWGNYLLLLEARTPQISIFLNKIFQPR